MHYFTLELVVLLQGVLPCFPMIDLICISVGRNTLVNATSLLRNGKYQPEFCQRQWWYDKTGVSGQDPFKVPLPWTTDGGATIGGRKYQIPFLALKALSFDKTGPGSEGCVSYSHASKKVMFDVFSVKQNGNRLHGWLSFEVTVYGDRAAWLYLQVSDEHGNAIGEFSTSENRKCGDKSRKDVHFPKPKQFLPCSAVGLQEPKVAQSLVYSDPDWLEKSVDPAKTGGKSGYIESMLGRYPKSEAVDNLTSLKYRVTWKLNEYYCNRHEKFQIIAYVLWAGDIEVQPEGKSPQGATFWDYDHHSTLFKRSFWMYPKWFGAADVIEYDTPLNCSELIYKNNDGTSQVSNLKDFWIETTTPNEPFNENNAEFEAPNVDIPTLRKSCRTFVTRLEEYNEDAINQPTFGGRCEKIDEKKFKPGFSYKHPNPAKQKPMRTRSIDVAHDCKRNPVAKYPKKMVDYREYIQSMKKNREKLCSQKATTCPKDFTAEDVLSLRERNISSIMVWRSRVFHGVTSTYAALCIIPASNFLARYFKETFLAHDVFGLRLWYFLHIGAFLMTLNLYGGSITAVLKCHSLYGTSWSYAGEVHRHAGWWCIGLFILVSATGPIRPLDHLQRKIAMIAHASLGIFQYFLGIVVMMSSTLIPGSPSADICYRDVDEELGGYSAAMQNSVARHSFAWVIMDVILHAAMDVLQYQADKGWEVKRILYFPLLPVLVGFFDKKDFKFFRYRSLILILYLFIMFCITTAILVELLSSDWKSCDLGAMSCTHSSSSLESAYRYNQCGRVAEIRRMRKEAKISEG